MKLLQDEELNYLKGFMEGQTGRVRVTLETYSCKMVTEDKKLYKNIIQQRCQGDSEASLQLGPPVTYNRPLGFDGANNHPSWPDVYKVACKSQEWDEAVYDNDGNLITDDIARDDFLKIMKDAEVKPKVFCNLILALDLAFRGDVDFSNSRPEDFTLEPDRNLVVKEVDDWWSMLFKAYNMPNELLHQQMSLKDYLWYTIENSIVMSQCEIYSFRGSNQFNPLNEDCVHPINFIFYNKGLNRILFFCFKVGGNHSPKPSFEYDPYMEDY